MNMMKRNNHTDNTIIFILSVQVRHLDDCSGFKIFAVSPWSSTKFSPNWTVIPCYLRPHVLTHSTYIVILPLPICIHLLTYTKVKLKLSPCLTKHHTMKTYWKGGGMASCILNLGTRWR